MMSPDRCVPRAHQCQGGWRQEHLWLGPRRRGARVATASRGGEVLQLDSSWYRSQGHCRPLLIVCRARSLRAPGPAPACVPGLESPSVVLPGPPGDRAPTTGSILAQRTHTHPFRPSSAAQAYNMLPGKGVVWRSGWGASRVVFVLPVCSHALLGPMPRPPPEQLSSWGGPRPALHQSQRGWGALTG